MGRRRAFRWYVAVVDAEDGERKKLDARLVACVADGYRLWSPCRVLRKLVDGEWTEVVEELYPGYLLVGCRLDADRVENDLGVDLLRFGGKARTVRDDEVERIEECESVEQYVGTPGLKVGDRVAIREDARSSHAGLSGVLEGVTYGNLGFRADVRLYLWEGMVASVSVPLDHLEPLMSAGS